jgi:hypothetical protein
MVAPHPNIPNNPNPANDEEQSREALWRRFALGVFYVLLPLLLIYLLFKIFPPQPWPTSDPETNKLVEDIPISFFRGLIRISTSLEERLLLLVMVAGCLGSYLHSATSFADFVGNRQFKQSWLWWYVLRPFIGLGLALTVYFAVRGGLLLIIINSNNVDINSAKNINPFGVAAVAALTGMFSKQAADKLAEVFSTLFRSAGDEKRKDSLTPAPAPVIKDIEPKRGSTEGGTRLTITGTGFLTGARVLFDGLPATNVEVVNDTTIRAQTPRHAAGLVDVRVENTDDKGTTVIGAYTYIVTDDAQTQVQSPPDDLTSPPGFIESPPRG